MECRRIVRRLFCRIMAMAAVLSAILIPGTQPAVLPAVSPASALCCAPAPVTSALVVDFSVEPPTVMTGYDVVFSPACSGGVAPLVYQWDFGDGSTSAEEYPVYAYSSPGTYTVTLTVTDSEAATETVIKPDCITVFDGVPPGVVTSPASEVGVTTATLNLDLSSLGSAAGATIYFETGLTASYGSSATVGYVALTGSYYYYLNGLTPSTTYHFRAVAVGHGTSYGEDMTFTTGTVSPPSVTTGGVTDVQTLSAWLNGRLVDAGSTPWVVSVCFEYGTVSGAYDHQTPYQGCSAGGGFVARIDVFPGTTYYYRAKAVGAVTAYGAEMSFTAPAVSTAPGRNCWAFIVGVADYASGSAFSGNLRYTDDSAQGLYDVLAPIWGEDHVMLLLSEQATKSSIKNVISGWLDPLEDSDDTVLIFFCGHGGQLTFDQAPLDEEDGFDEYIVPYDADLLEDIILDDELGVWLGDLESARQAVIIDSCYSGGFVGGSLGEDLCKTGRVVLTGSAEDEVGWESADLGFSVFGFHLLEGFKHVDGVDANGDHRLSVQELFSYAQLPTSEYEATHDFESVQHPQVWDADAGEMELVVLTTLTIDASPRVTPVTLDGRVYPELPVSVDFLPGSSHTFSFSAAVSVEGGEELPRCTFVSWSDNVVENSRTVTVSGSASYVAVYRTQYYLSVLSDRGETEGSGWYDAGSEAGISVRYSSGPIVRQVFAGWSGDFSSSEKDSTVVMDGPKTVEALWRTDYTRLCMLLGGVFAAGLAGAVAGVGIGIFMWRRSRRLPAHP